MVMMEEGSLPFPDPIIGVHIPRRTRSCCVRLEPEDHGGSISMEEAATIMISIANGGFCKDEMETKEDEKRTQSGKKRRKEMELPNPPPEMPACMRERIVEMGGYDIQLVIQKQLEESDVSRNHGRLCLPAKKVRREFMTEEERRALEEEDEDSNNNKKKKKKKKMMKMKKGMEVRMMDEVLRESWIWLKKWKIGSGQVYCLMTNWNSFVEESGLRSGDCIQLWSFRKDDDVHSQTPIPSSHRLCFAIVKLHISSHSLSL